VPQASPAGRFPADAVLWRCIRVTATFQAQLNASA
jgi:hypothetical protein